MMYWRNVRRQSNAVLMYVLVRRVFVVAHGLLITVAYLPCFFAGSNIFISPPLGISCTTIIPSCGVTVVCIHHNTNNMRRIGTCADSVGSICNMSLIFHFRGNSRVIKHTHFNTKWVRVTHISVTILYHHRFRQWPAACLVTADYVNQWCFFISIRLEYISVSISYRLFSDNPLYEPMIVCCQLD